MSYRGYETMQTLVANWLVKLLWHIPNIVEVSVSPVSEAIWSEP
jgi:hypothetical protein